jgi:1-acyl-sn-glycerol-3-phosphate acyltransferase
MLSVGLAMLCIDTRDGFHFSIRHAIKEYKVGAVIVAVCAIVAFVTLEMVERLLPSVLRRFDPIEGEDYAEDMSSAPESHSQALLGDAGARSSASKDRPLKDNAFDP